MILPQFAHAHNLFYFYFLPSRRVLLSIEDRPGDEILQIDCIIITCLSHFAQLKHNLRIICSDQKGITCNMEKMAIEQNFSGINCHLRIDHPGMGR